jgi:intracellular sulfur oxidation DsrE/DsrF family protein
MIANCSSRVALICAGIFLAGCCAMASDAQTEASATPAAQRVAQKTEKAPQKKVTKPDAAPMHKVAIQVSDNDKNLMNRALNNTKNLVDLYKAKGETVVVEIVTFHDGLHMLRSESPVKDRIAVMSLENPNVKFMACGNTQANQSKAEGKPVTLLSEATVVPSGIVRLIELQKQGYAYIRP